MEGIVYRIQPYQEHGRLMFTYTPQGKVTLLASGAQKLNQVSRVIAQYLTKIEFKEGTKSFIRLQDAVIKNDFTSIKNDFQKTKSAALMLEIIDRLVVDNANHPLIYHELSLALDAVDIELASLSFALKMMQELGYGLQLYPDGRMVKGVSMRRGSLVYQDESESVDLETKDAVSLLKLTLMPYHEFISGSIENTKQIKEFIVKYYAFHLQTTLKNLQ